MPSYYMILYNINTKLHWKDWFSRFYDLLLTLCACIISNTKLLFNSRRINYIQNVIIYSQLCVWKLHVSLLLKTATRGQVNRPILGRYWAAIQLLLDRYSAVTGPLDSRFWASIGPVMAQCRQIIRTLACTMYWQHVMGQYWPSTGCRCTVLPVPAITDPMLARYRHVDWGVTLAYLWPTFLGRNAKSR